MEHKNIFEALLAVYGEVGYVQKQRSEGLKYSFAGEGAFIRELRPALIEHGITVQVLSMSNLHQEQYQAGYEGKTTMTRSTIHGTVRFSHVSGTFVDVEAYGEGADTGDKSVNKAMTDMYKYALRQTFMIETGDDPDKDPSEPSVVAEAQKLGAVERQEPKKNPPVPLDNIKEMTLDFARSVSTAKGEKYGDIKDDKLTFMYNAICERAPSEENEMKKNAIKVILKSRQK